MPELALNMFVGLSLEDMDELFAQDSVRGKFAPTRRILVNEECDLKMVEDQRFDHIDRV